MTLRVDAITSAFIPKMCSTLCVCLVFMIFWNVTVKPVRCISANRYVDKGKTYDVYNTENNFYDAQVICEENEGMLAQISHPTVTDSFYAPLSVFLSSRIGENCAWIGARDYSGGGWWYWTDGTPVLSVPWTIPPADIFHRERFSLNCGRLCKGDNEWVWEPVGCDARLKFVCEHVHPGAEHCVTKCTTPAPPTSPIGITGTDASRFVMKGKIFKIPDNETDFADAMAFCERDGGRLAIIKPEPGTMMINAQMSRFLSSRAGESCVYIGASDRETEGIWVWIDGTRVYSVLWYSNRHFGVFLQYTLDCGCLCPDPESGWIYQQKSCDQSSKFVCEYNEAVSKTTVKPALKPKVKPVLKPKPKPVGNKATRTVVTRLADPKLIIGDAVLITLAAVPTMCSRICMQTKNCRLFNFNVATHECRGYRRTNLVTYRDDANWTVWVLERV